MYAMYECTVTVPTYVLNVLRMHVSLYALHILVQVRRQRARAMCHSLHIYTHKIRAYVYAGNVYAHGCWMFMYKNACMHTYIHTWIHTYIRIGSRQGVWTISDDE
jgi:hypothetical protein